MGKTKNNPLLPSSPEARENLLAVIRSTNEPAPAKAIAKLLLAPHEIPEKQLVPILEEHVAAGALHKTVGKTAKSKPLYWDRDARALTRAAVVDAIQHVEKPFTTKELLARLVSPVKVAVNDVMAVLEECVAGGALFKIPGKSAAAKPAYWNRDLHVLARTAALEAMQRAAKPFTAAEIAKQLDLPIKVSAGDLQPLIDESLAPCTLYEFPAKSAKGKPRYWNRDRLEFGRLAMLSALDGKGPQTEAKLKKAAEGLTDTEFQQLLQSELAALKLWRHPPAGKKGKDLFGKHPPSPELYLRDIEKQLTAITAKLKAVNVPLDSLRRALIQMIESAGVPFAAAGASTHEKSSTASAMSVDLIGLMRRIDPAADRGALVGARELRRAAGMLKADFDRAVLELARQERLSLHRHDYAASLSPAERDELVTDGAGTYYVGIALRQSSG